MTYPLMTGFGAVDLADVTNLTDFSFFRVQIGERGQYNDWESEELGSVHQIAGSNTYDQMFMGYGPAELTLTVEFDTAEDFMRFRGRVASMDRRIGTLVLVAGFTSHVGERRIINGHEYEYLPDTTLLLPRRVVSNVDGTRECDVTFRRQEVL